VINVLTVARRVALCLGAALCALLAVATPASAASAAPDPTFNCAAANGDGTYTYFFGYSLGGRVDVQIPIGSDNQFSSSNNTLADSFGVTGKQNLGQPTRFSPGTFSNVFSVTSTDGTLIWHLGNGHVKVDASNLCANVPVVAEAPTALVLPIATAAPFAVWFITMRRRSRRTASLSAA
jgi:hypothetical protein